MTQHIDLSLVGKVRGRGVRRKRRRKRMVHKGKEGRNKIYAIRQIYVLLGFLDAHSFIQRLYIVDCMFSRVLTALGKMDNIRLPPDADYRRRK